MDTSGQRRKKPKESEPKFYTSTPFLVLLAIGLVAILFFIWYQNTLNTQSTGFDQTQDNLTGEIAVPEQTTPKTFSNLEDLEQIPDTGGGKTVSGQTGTPSAKSIDDNQSSMRLAQPTDQQSLDEFLSTNPEKESQQNENTVLAEQQKQEGNLESHEVVPLSDTCTASVVVVNDFYRYLDEQEYLQEFAIKPNSQTYFTNLIQKLMDNPPIVSGETSDLFTILQNTAHFFRIIGNDNIKILKTILINENDRFEDVLANFYNTVDEPRCAKDSFNLRLPDNALYEYAGFFLNTMGGRLYLFRRDSVSRMVISYYSILLIDKANKAAANTHGIEIATSIDLLIDEMESTSNRLKLRDNYLVSLYDLQEEYQ